MEQATLQKIASSSDSSFERAKKYYATIFIANSIEISQRELEMASFIGISGNIFETAKKKEFCELVGTSMAVAGNLISSLYKKKIVVKTNESITIHPAISLNFEQPIILEVSLK